MSLLRRLWLSIGVLLITVFAVTMTVFGVSGSNTLQEQLAIETQNTARSLAQVLSLEAEVSGADELDPVIVQLRLSPFTDLSELRWNFATPWEIAFFDLKIRPRPRTLPIGLRRSLPWRRYRPRPLSCWVGTTGNYH